ncbi:MAG TPA: sulfate transporter CysZ [Pseudomonadales bacterium]|nr:sulfate transporter CysZ [Pseudomonadales bacterium]
MQNEIKQGALYFVQGFKMLLKPGLRNFVVIPLLISFLVFASVIGPAVYYISEALNLLVSKLPEWLSFLYWIITTILIVLLLLVSGYFFNIVTSLIAAPFNSFLAEKTETLLTGKQSASLSGVSEMLQLITHSIKRELDKLWYYLPRLTILIVLTFIPGINVLASFAWLIMGAWMLAIQYSDYPMDNNKISFKNMLLLLKQERAIALGFGLATTAMLSVPVLNMLAMPAAVIGATCMWVDLHQTKTVSPLS